jgi:hypothetical protein
MMGSAGKGFCPPYCELDCGFLLFLRSGSLFSPAGRAGEWIGGDDHGFLPRLRPGAARNAPAAFFARRA